MPKNNLNDQTNFKSELFKYMFYWKLFILTIILSFIVCFFYIKYKNPVFLTVSKIKIVGDDKSLKLPSDFLSLMGSNSKINLENEIEVLNSKRLFEPIIRELNLTTRYFSEGKFRNTELWNTSIRVSSLANTDSIFETFSFKITTDIDGYLINTNGKNIFLKGNDVKAIVEGHELLIESKLGSDSGAESTEYIIVISCFRSELESSMKKLNVEAVGKESEVLSVSIKDVNTNKSEAFINKIIENFNQDGINDKQLVSKKTVEFIDSRFKFLTHELDSIETQKKEYKRSNNLTFIEADTKVNVETKASSSEGVFKVETQIALSNLLKDALNSKTRFSILPANIGLDNLILNSLINDFNTLVLQRDKLLKTAGEENPSMKYVESQIITLKDNINQSIKTYSQQLNVALLQEKNNYRESNDLVANLPMNEKVLRGIERQQQIKENLYLILLQKREESAISYAVTAPSVKIIDYASSGISPIAPKKSVLYLAALVAGLFIPFAFLYIYFLFETRIKYIDQIKVLSPKVPIIAEIPFFEGFNVFKDKNDRSIHAEVFRTLTSNVNFSLPLKKDDGLGNVVLVTSSIMGEGKTFIASNLALALSSYDKKVLLVEADMRKPKIGYALQMESSEKGLSSYLSDVNINWRDLIVKKGVSSAPLKVLFAGIIPPNPSYLFSNGRLDSLIDEAKSEFDYIIVDSAPTIYVNDTFLISPLVDLSIYVTRFNYTERELLKYSKKINKDSKLPNMVYVLNGIQNKSNFRYKYNYGYGYGYSEIEKDSSFKQFYNDPLKYISKYIEVK